MIRSFIRDLMPDYVLKVTRRWRGLKHEKKVGYFGDYPSWEAAAAEAGPYKMNLTAMDDLMGQTGFVPGLSFMAVMAGLVLAPLRPRVLDFGGGLGSAYLSAKQIVDLGDWTVIEQADVVDYRHQNPIPGGGVSFGTDLRYRTADVVLCLGTLQYLPDPYATLTELGTTAPVIVLDRLPLGKERFAVQHIPEHLGGPKLAFRVLDFLKVLDALSGFRVIAGQRLFTTDGIEFHAMVLQRVFPHVRSR